MKIEERLDCEFHRIDPDAKNFHIFVENSKKQNYVTKSTKQLTEKLAKEEMKHKLVKKLLDYMARISKP